ncbi:MAG: adenine phosphoribosyltransferase [Pseudanabaenaceae cyanobacterium]
MEIARLIKDVPDFPRPGIIFKDITPILADPTAFRTIVTEIAQAFADAQVEGVVAIESRGFIIGAPIAHVLNCAFIPVRKPKKLPRAVYRVEYTLEYGLDALEMHQDAIHPQQRILIIDDVLATGGTASAAAKLVQTAGGTLVGFGFVIELSFLKGRQNLGDAQILSLIHY